jgi:hypothetical protein
MGSGSRTDAPGDVVLQVEGPAGTFTDYAFSDVPAARRSWIVLRAFGSTSLELVRELGDELRTLLRASSPQVVESNTPGVGPAGHAKGDRPGRRKLLVLVAGADEQFADDAWYENWESDEHDASVMTVVPPLTKPKSFQDLLPATVRSAPQHILRRVNGISWKDKVTEVAPAILARADVTSGSARVFISYRRLETAAIALPLFDRLTHQGFEVFLDQFSIPPGYDFQRRLGQELQDKSMVVLLESEHARDSKWTQHEIDFAKRHRLGLLSIRMPRVKMPIVPDHASYPLDEATDFDGTFTEVTRSDTDPTLIKQWPKLKDDALDRVVAEIKRAHAAALFLRRERLRSNLIAAFREAGLTARTSGAGPMWVKGDGDEHLIWLTTRPAGVDDFQELFLAHDSWTARTAGSRGVLVGPQAALEPDRLARLEWLQRVTECVAFDEGRLDDVVTRVRSGKWK